MTELFLERDFDPGLKPQDVLLMGRDASGCFALHQVDWRASLLAMDGTRMVCKFAAPDLESARIALRQLDADIKAFWRGSIHDAPGIDKDDVENANVLVERRFEQPVSLENIQAIEDAGIGCLDLRGVRFIQTFYSLDRKRMLCLYAAPDAESVREAQREAKVPFERAWAFQWVIPSN